jgi:hypothetical protein
VTDEIPVCARLDFAGCNVLESDRIAATFRSMRRAIIIPAILLVFSVNTALGWGQGHRLIREWAVARLPEWQTSWIGEENLRRLCADYKSLQDRHAGGKAPELDPYCKVPGVRLSLHDVNGPTASARGMVWYLDQIVAHLKRGDTDEAMKFLGVLCHWNEDPGCPSAHSSPISEEQLKILLPPPTDKARYNYLYGAGGIADIGKYTIPEGSYEPRLLGRTIDEVALRIYQHQRLLERGAAARIIPLVQDMMHGDGNKAAAERAAAAAANARHICDVIHTSLCLAKSRFDGGRKLDEPQSLTEWLPDPTKKRAPHPYYVTGFLTNQALDAKRKLHPLRFAAGAGQIRRGFGTGAPFTISYTLAPNPYRRFSVQVGFHSAAAANGAVSFEIHANGKTIHRTLMLRVGGAPIEIDVELPESEILKLALVTVPEDAADSLANLVVWAEPTLRR